MCLTVPGKVVEISEGNVVVDYETEKREISMNLVDDLKVGDYVIVSNKIIVSKVDAKKAEEFLEVLNGN